MKTRFHLLTILLAGLVVACAKELPDAEPARAVSSPQPNPTATESAMPKSPFRVIAYVTGSVVPEVIPYNRLTHINYSFLIPNGDGSFVSFANGWKLEKIITQAHQADVEVLISVGGWGWDEQFETMAADSGLRATFVRNLDAFVDQYDLDGADIDWEYPDPGHSAENFLLLIQELRLAMPDKLLTTAVVSYGETGDGVLSETFDLFDFVNVMTYEGPDHGSMEQFQAGLDYWQGRGLDPWKTVMGVPFYAQPTGTTYRKLIEADPQAADRDLTDFYGTTVHYNGRPTIRDKTHLAMERAGGIMFWSLEQDSLDEHSLLKAINEVVRGEAQGKN